MQMFETENTEHDDLEERTFKFDKRVGVICEENNKTLATKEAKESR